MAKKKNILDKMWGGFKKAARDNDKRIEKASKKNKRLY
jgi:hypothetical protein